MQNTRLPSTQDVSAGLAELPLDVRLRLRDSHFSGPKDRNPISFRVDDRLLKSITTFLMEIKFRGGIPWLESQSDVLRAGLWLLLDVYGHYYGSEMTPELASVITS